MDQPPVRFKEQEKGKLRASSVPFSTFPHQSKLFIDYLRDPISLRRYYPNAVASHTELSAQIPEVLANYKTDRNALCDTLMEINSEIGASDSTFEHIKLLSKPETVAVVTGQQAGLFTGPLYTIYKALSAIKMAKYLSTNGSQAVPVFWAATEDHDFDEVSHTFLLDKSGQLIESDYKPHNYLENSPVGNIQIDSSIIKAIDYIFTRLPHTEFSDTLRDAVRRAWPQGELFGTAFAKNLADIFGKFGLIFIDPRHKSLKSLAAPIYVEAIEKSAEIVANICSNSRKLESDGFHAQVLVEEDYFPLFWHDDRGRRIALRKTGEDLYSSKGEKAGRSLSELGSIAANEPHRFSPGVMLRPVVQDYLLPTVCYLGGAAEIAYFAQNCEAYRILGRPVSPILHRQSFTVVEARHRRTLDKFELEFSDLFEKVEKTLERIGRKQLSGETARLFAEAEEKINTELNRLDQNVAQIDPTLAENLAKRRRKIIYHISALHKRAYLATVRKDETIERQIRSAFDALLPKGQLQERVLNVNSFLNKYGPYFIDLIYETIDLNDKDHRIVDLGYE